MAGTRHPRWPPTIRTRLTLLYGGLFLLSGAALLALTYALVEHFPVISLNRITIGPGPVSPHPGLGPPGVGSLGEPTGTEAALDQAASQRDADLRHLLARSGTALAIMVVLSVGLGWLIAGRVLRPLRTITTTTRRISASSLHQRLALRGPRDELTELGDTIDALLARLDRSFTAQRQFIANASHELRTPLTLQRALLEAALTDPEPTLASWRVTGERALAAGARQELLITALLTLARGESGLDHREPVELAAVVETVLAAQDQRTARARRGLRMNTDLTTAPTTGDPRLLAQLATNLIDNAITHNVDGGWLSVRCAHTAEHAVLTVANGGPVLAEDQLDRLVRPFQRADERRTTSSGLGLGLSIVKAIATAHDARLDLSAPATGGLTATVSIPRDPSPSTAGPSESRG